VWAAVAVDAVPAVRHPRVRVRLLQALLLTLPNGPLPRPRVVGIDARSISLRAMSFAVRVANPSNVHGWVASTSLQLRAIHGHALVRTAALLPRVVLPHSTRQVQLAPTRRLAAGRYRALVTMRVGKVTTRRSFLLMIARHAPSARR
jgi:hypothetical protein